MTSDLLFIHQNHIAMKNKLKTLTGILLIMALLLCSGRQMSGQEKINVSVGIGFLETLNVGIRYQVNQTQMGLSIGTWPSKADSRFDWNSLISISGDFYYHFGGYSEFSDLQPWYGRIGLDFIELVGMMVLKMLWNLTFGSAGIFIL